MKSANKVMLILSPLTVKPIDAAHMSAVCELFERVFDKPMSETFWRWKYVRSNSHALGVWDGERLVAHYGGLGADIVYNGEPAKAVQIVDVMVERSARQAVRRHSPFFLSTSQFLDQFIGYTRPYLLGYGFPSDRHLQLAQHLGLYDSVGRMSEFCLQGGPRSWADRILRFEELDSAGLKTNAAALDALWQRMQLSLPREAILVRKEQQWLQRRYVQHPAHQYRFWLWRAPLSRRILGLAIVKLEAERIFLMDVFAHSSDFARVVRLVANRATRLFALPTVGWLSTSWLSALGLNNIETRLLPISTPANIWTEGPSAATLQDRWCLTAGDTDYL